MGRSSAQAGAELLGIFWSLHLGDCGSRNANFYVIGNLQNKSVAVDTIAGAIDAGGGDDLVAVLHGAEHLLQLLSLPLLRHDHQEIHDAEHQQQGEHESTKPADAACLPK